MVKILSFLLLLKLSALGQAFTLNDLAFMGNVSGAGGGGGGGYTAYATTFAGDGQCEMTSASSIADAKAGSFSCWLKFNGGDGAYQFLLSGGSQFHFHRYNNNTLYFALADVSATTLVEMYSTATVTADSNWHHVMASWDKTVPACWVAVDGTFGTTTNTLLGEPGNTAVISYSTGGTIHIGGSGDTQPLNACISEYWFNTNYFAATSANVEKFRTVGAKPVNLGADGSTPCGVQPFLYFKDPYTTFTNNSGSLGDFTKVGTTAFTTCTAP